MYDEMYEDVKRFLSDNDKATKITSFPFRIRSEHIWRVFNWAKRLIDESNYETIVDRDAVLIAALFHDVGYSLPIEDMQHAQSSAIIFNRYAREKNLRSNQAGFISYLIENHSEKSLMDSGDTPLELILLMEADLLDETGALSVVWDCMAEGGQAEQNYSKTYRHIEEYSYRTLSKNPMKTDKAKEFWAEKQNAVKEFMKHLSSDLAIV